MNQDGMPMRFRAHINANTTIHFVLEDIVNPNALFSVRELLIPWLLAGNIPDQAIGATSSDDPPQDIYVGDLIEFEYSDDTKGTGLIVWKNFCVYVKHKYRDQVMYWAFGQTMEYRKIKKLGSCYTHPGILKKAGLEKS